MTKKAFFISYCLVGNLHLRSEQPGRSAKQKDGHLLYGLVSTFESNGLRHPLSKGDQGRGCTHLSGARVLLACRNFEKAQEAVTEIKLDTGNENIEIYRLDLASLKSVRECAVVVTKNEERLDILINNAGVFIPPEGSKTADGFELHFGVNHLGHFLLTNLLLDLLKKSAPRRIVIVSSSFHRFVKFDFDNLANEKNLARLKVYSHSKLANILFGLELSKRIKGTGVTTYSLHPGLIETDIARHVKDRLGCCQYLLKCCCWPLQLVMKDVWMGIQTTIYCAVAEELEGVTGKYYSDCAEKVPSEEAKNEANAARLWTLSEEMTGFVPATLQVQTGQN